MPEGTCRVTRLALHPLPHAQPRLSTAPHSRQKAVRSYLGGVVSRKPSSMHGPHVDLEVAHRGGHHLHERPLGVKHLPQCWRGRHRQPGLRRPAHPPALHHRPHVSERAGPARHALCGVALRPRSHDGCDAPWGTQVGRGVEDRPHGWCQRCVHRAVLRSRYGPRIMPPSIGPRRDAGGRLAQPIAPGTGVTGDAQLSIRRGGA